VARVLRERTRHHDVLARIGGDEFAVLLSGASETAAGVVAEDIRAAVARELILDGAGTTISVGIATGRNPIPNFEDLLRLADAAMYEGKRAGGDTVTPAPGTPAARP